MSKLDNINAKIVVLGNAEKVTRAVLSELSRELLDYVIVEGTHDIAAVNRTLQVLTPMNKQTAILFFTAFLPHKLNEDTGLLGGMDKKQRDKKLELTTAFLADETNDIWSWAKENIEPLKTKEVDYLGKVTKAIQQAIEKGSVSQLDLVKAITAGGVELSSIMALMQSAVPADAEAADALAIKEELGYVPPTIAGEVQAGDQLPM